MNTSTFKATEFLSIAIKLLSESGKVLKEVLKSENLQTKMKGVNDPVTIADLKIQNLIKKGINYSFPDLKIIGEEDSSNYTEAIGLDVTKINKNLIPLEIFKIPFQEIQYEESILWIDPLDGTINFVSGEYEGVTSLMGISNNGVPLLGLIAQYYRLEGTEYIYDPVYYFSHSLQNQVFYIKESEIDLEKENNIPWELKRMTNNEYSQNNFIIVASKNHNELEIQEKMKLLDPSEIRAIGGCGNKALSVVKNTSHLYFYPKTGTSKWDTCAPTSLILSMGGFVKDKYGNDLEYKYNEGQNYLNDDGIIITCSKEILEKCIEVCK